MRRNVLPVIYNECVRKPARLLPVVWACSACAGAPADDRQVPVVVVPAAPVVASGDPRPLARPPAKLSTPMMTDEQARAEVRSAIEEYYLDMKFGEAEAMVQEVIRRCRHQCSANVVAEAWMYRGIIRGRGLEDDEGMQRAFEKALARDPRVKLDPQYANPDVIRAFEDVRRAQPKRRRR